MTKEKTWEEERLEEIDRKHGEALASIVNPERRENYRQQLLMLEDLEGQPCGGIFNAPTPGMNVFGEGAGAGGVFSSRPSPILAEPIIVEAAEPEAYEVVPMPPPPSDPTLTRAYLVFSVLLVVACAAGTVVSLRGPVPYMAAAPAAVALLFLWQVFRNVRARRQR